MPRQDERCAMRAVASLNRRVGAAAELDVLDRPAGAVHREERMAAGRSLRDEVPRSAHGDWAPSKTRTDPIAALQHQDRTRVPELLPIRYARMVESPLSFFRGAAAVMAGDLAETPTTGIVVQVCGDCHLANFGGFGTPERRIVFDVNDFDETLPGPWEWDLKRLAASFVVAARAKRLDDEVGLRAVLRMTSSYADLMRELATMPTLEAWHFNLDACSVLALAGTAESPDTRAFFTQAIARAQAHDNLRAIERLTDGRGNRRRFIERPPLLRHLPAEDDAMRLLFERYKASLPDAAGQLVARYELVDVARMVVGVGSVGTRCRVLLLNGGAGDDPLVLQIKQADRSVLEPHVGPSPYGNNAHRVVHGQMTMQAASDMFLGWAHDDAAGVDYYVRNLCDMKAHVDVARHDAEALMVYATLCGATIARAHARSGDAAPISGYVGKGRSLGAALGRFGLAYAAQNDRDHRALVDAIAAGVLPWDRTTEG
jgi:uncharacterized protein (DUF2252 family)